MERARFAPRHLETDARSHRRNDRGLLSEGQEEGLARPPAGSRQRQTPRVSVPNDPGELSLALTQPGKRHGDRHDLRDLTVDFSTDAGTVHAVRGISFDVAPGEVVAVVGESGSGKSVSSRAMLGLLPEGGQDAPGQRDVLELYRNTRRADEGATD